MPEDARDGSAARQAGEWLEGPAWLAIPRATIKEFNEDQAPLHAAALAFFALFAVTPLVVLLILLASLMWGDGESARGWLFDATERALGPANSDALQQLIASVEPPGSGLLATALGAAVLVYAASRAFLYLEISMNRIWDVRPRADRSFARTAKKRLLSFAMVLAIGFLLLAAVVVTTLMAGLTERLMALVAWNRVTFEIARAMVLVVLVAFAFMGMYRYLPDAKIRWRQVAVGSAVSAVLFVAGQYGIALVMGDSTLVESFGQLATVAVILLWFYYSALIVLLGAEFTQVWARHRGEPIEPEEDIAEREGRKKDRPTRPGGSAGG